MQGDQKVTCQPDYTVKKDDDNPFDTVTSIVWNTYVRDSDDGFFVSSWDGFIRYYQIKGKGYRTIEKVWDYFCEHPVLACDLTPDLIVLAGLANGYIIAVDVKNSANFCVIGNHEAPICSLIWLPESALLCSLGFDTELKIWGLQNNNSQFFIKSYKLPEKTYTTSYSFPYILIGSSESRIFLFDVRALDNPIIPQQYQDVGFQRASKLLSSSICSRTKKIMIGGVDGRLAYISFNDVNKNIKFHQQYISKCQKDEKRKNLGQITSVQVNCYNGRPYGIANGTFELQLLNLEKRKLPKIFKGVQMAPITMARVHPNNELLAYASGSDWSKGLDELHEPKKPKIYLVFLRKQDVQLLTS